jgi:hypothetical protein
MLNTDILDKLFRVQATLEHLAQLDEIGAMERRYLKRALALQAEVVRAVCADAFEQAKLEPNEPA